MNIRPKNMILYADTGVKFSQNNLGGANWRQQVFNNYRQHLLDQLAKYGEADDYGYWLNEMQSRHANLYNLAGGEKGNWENVAYKNDLVGQYQQDYKGGLGNNGQYQRYGTIQISPDDRYDFNQTGIRTNQDTRYNIANPPRRVSGDYSREGYNYKVDNLYSAITDDRRLLGRKGDWDENSNEFKQWQSDLNKSGWETYLDTKDNYYKLRRLTPKFDNQNGVSPTNSGTRVPVGHQDKYGFDWEKLKEGAQKLFSNPDLWATARLAGNLINNERVYDEALKGIKPVLRQTYNTHRQVVGDEATKQAYYRRAAQGQTKAVQPFTSDADRQMAYQFEAKRVGDELRAQGDLADNQEIRRTSDESNQHQWANTQRATEVANANRESLVRTNAEKHKLLAQKHSAQWSSIDNYLQGIEYRKRQKNAEQQALDDQIFSLQQQYELQSDPRIINAQKKYQAVLDKHKLSSGGYDTNNDEVIAAKREYQAVQTELAIEQYKKTKEYYQNKGVYSAKSGTKITHKKKDDLLYKSTKDVVEHFRKMSKMSSDAQNRKTPKIEKLTSHPKGSTRKYQQGGTAPFTVYKPVALGGETTTSTQTGTSSTKSSKNEEGKDTLDFVKSLFKEVQGLPVDVNSVYSSMYGLLQKADLFGNELSTNDISLMYLQAMQQLSEVKYGKEVFEKAKDVATSNESLNEFAVTASGKYITQDKEGKIKEATLKEIEEKDLNPITNEQLLFLRANNPELALRNGNYLVENVINNGIGINKIGAQIKALAGSIASSESKIEGISKVDSNNIKQGLQELANAPEGYYQVTKTSKNQSKQVQAAIAYIKNMLSPSQRAILDIHGGTDNLIQAFLSSQMGDNQEISITPLTGKAANKNGEDSGEKVTATFNDLIQRQQVGIPREFSMITKEENTKLYSFDAKYVPTLNKVNGDMSIQNMLATSEIGNILDSRLGITFGDQVINPDNLKDIMFSVGGGATFVTLPCKYENGHKVVNFAIKDDFDEAIKEASKTTPINWTDQRFTQNLANILKKKGLDSLLTGNMELDPNMLGLFMVVEGYTTDRVKFNKNSKYIEKISNPDKELENRLNNALSTKGANGKVQNYGVDINDWGIGPLFEGGWDDIYHGSVFIPLNNDPVSAQIGQSNLNRAEARQLASEYQNYQKLIKANKNNQLYEVE